MVSLLPLIEPEHTIDHITIDREKTSDPTKEIITVSADSRNENILVNVSLNERFQIKDKSRVSIYWREENKFVNFTLYDINRNNIFDLVEWNVEHFSNQTFIIEITNAEYLDSNKVFISNIFDDVKQLDGNWSEIINHSEYVRVWFEENLTSSNDITIYVRNNQSFNTKIDVYEFNTSNLIGSFPNISIEDYYRFNLTNLISPDDKFDLRINNTDGNSNAFLEFEHIIDPPQETWYFRNNTGINCPIGVNALELNQTPGTIATTINISDEKVWNRPESRDLDSGIWRLRARVTTTVGTGVPNVVQAVVERRDSSCIVQEEIFKLNMTTAEGICKNLNFPNLNLPPVNFSFGDILTVKIFRVEGTRDNFLCYDGSSPTGQTSLRSPVNVTEPAPPPPVENESAVNVTNVISKDNIFSIVQLGSSATSIGRASIPYAQQGEQLNFTNFNVLQLGESNSLINLIGLSPLNILENIPNFQLNKTKEFIVDGLIQLGKARI